MKAIILDRDGVINEECLPHVCSPSDWIPIPGSLEAIALLNQLGYQVFIVTNQSGIGKGLYSLETLEQIHECMRNALKAVGGQIRDILFCPHHPNAGCDCRKPHPTLLLKLAERYSLNLSKTYFIGDSFSDILAAQACGAKPVLVHTGKGLTTSRQHQAQLQALSVLEFKNLMDFVYRLKHKAF